MSKGTSEATNSVTIRPGKFNTLQSRALSVDLFLLLKTQGFASKDSKLRKENMTQHATARKMVTDYLSSK